MEEEFDLFEATESVFRLILPIRDLRTDLLHRGVRAEGIDEILDAEISEDLPATLDEAVAYSFVAHEGKYAEGRFGDGAYGVFYSAIEKETAIEEVRHHSKELLLEDGQERRRWMIECNFSGEAANLLGLEVKYTDLVSQNESGYPFCQTVARKAIASNFVGFHTRSARRSNGICVPVFSRATLKRPMHVESVRFFRESDDIQSVVDEVV